MGLLLYLGAALLVVVGVAHSYLGERYILVRLFRRNDLPKIRGSSQFTARTLRFAWHLTSVAWLGFAAILVSLANPPASPGILGLIIGGTFLLHAAIASIPSRGRHLSWPIFLVIGLLTIFATQT
jgi:hypothetical protein